MNEQVKKPKHPLAHVPLDYIRDEAHFFELWDAEMMRDQPTFDVLYGLLHVGLKIEGSSAMIIWFLDMADGYHEECKHFREEGLFHSHDSFGGNRIRTSHGTFACVGKLRRALAEKALAELCVSVFRPALDEKMPREILFDSRQCNLPSWAEGLVLEKLVWFFRESRGILGDSKMYNIPPSPCDSMKRHLVAVCDFAGHLARYGLWKPEKFVEADSRKTFGRLQPEFVRILCYLGQQDEVRSCTSSLNSRSLKMLRRIALANNRRILGDYRKPKTLEEAVVGGSATAQLLNTILIERRLNRAKNKKAQLLAKKERLKAELARLET